MIKVDGDKKSVDFDPYDNKKGQTCHRGYIAVSAASGEIVVSASGTWGEDIENATMTPVEAAEVAGIFREAAGMKCSACKHYVQSTFDNQSAHGACRSPKFVKGYDGLFGREIPADGVSVESDEGWGFMVGSDFGCIHFERKETA